MKVKELIQRLESEDPNMRVVIQGYEQGYDEVKIVEVNFQEFNDFRILR